MLVEQRMRMLAHFSQWCRAEIRGFHPGRKNMGPPRVGRNLYPWEKRFIRILGTPKILGRRSGERSIRMGLSSHNVAGDWLRALYVISTGF
jgi:hypothetical protein